MVVFLSTNLMPQTLFALLMTASLLKLLDDRALMAGFLAGLATLASAVGVALIAACILTLVARRRLRSAVIFTGVATVMVAPWFGWSLAHPGNMYLTSSIFTALYASDKLVVLGRNLMALLIAPFRLLSGFGDTLTVVLTVLLAAWSLFVRRQLLPDLFIALYGLVLLFSTWPPDRLAAPMLPLILWIAWRAFRLIELKEAVVATVLVGALFPLWADASRTGATIRSGTFPVTGPPADDWVEMRKLFAFITANTKPDSVLVSNLDGAFYLNTGRKAIRGFVPNGFELYYAPRISSITPDRFGGAITQAKANYVVLTPDNGLPESASFHRSVEALERGGVLEPVSVPGSARDYRLLRVNR
jgi:hypothetical protein